MESSRRQQAQADLGINTEKELARHENALAKEQVRQDKKEARRRELMNETSYRTMVSIAKYMDKYCLDPLIGLIPCAVGDVLSSALAIPYIHFSIFKVKSLPLTLAVVYNILLDVLIGSIPFFIGNILDFFNRSYVANLKLITGYVEDNKEIINEVNRKAFRTGVMILVILGLIGLVVYGVCALVLAF